ncbi:MAG: sulfurtransferase TusA family protein [Fibrobacteria bacterium]|nr:sulfurtransferase TusA family protein [Fibrobacteria bacterium]
MRHPQPMMKLVLKANSLSEGSTLKIHSDCPRFMHEIGKWCDSNGKKMLSVVEQGAYSEVLLRI